MKFTKFALTNFTKISIRFKQNIEVKIPIHHTQTVFIVSDTKRRNECHKNMFGGFTDPFESRHFFAQIHGIFFFELPNRVVKLDFKQVYNLVFAVKQKVVFFTFLFLFFQKTPPSVFFKKLIMNKLI